MRYDPSKHHRRSIRLKGYDYSSDGAYFITICTYQRECLFGEVVDGVMELNQVGIGVQACWQALPHHFVNLKLDAFVVMPNHLHGILLLGCDGSGGEAFGQNFTRCIQDQLPNASPLQPRGTESGSIGAIVQNFKSISSRRVNQMLCRNRRTLWQRNYYEHIIRDSAVFHVIQEYIASNPSSWMRDQLYPCKFSN
jgi:putative transposase